MEDRPVDRALAKGVRDTSSSTEVISQLYRDFMS